MVFLLLYLRREKTTTKRLKISCFRCCSFSGIITSRAWSRMRSKRLLIFIKCTRDKAGIFFSSSIQRDAGPNSLWVRRFLCLTARPNSSSSFSVPLYSGEWPQTKRALCFFQSVLSFSLAYSRHHYCWFCEQRMVNSY